MVTKRESEVLKQIETHGGFSVFWATELQSRAKTIDRLSNDGLIERVPGGQFPWCPYRVRYVNAGPMKPRPISEEPGTDEEADQCECHERDSSYTCDYCKRKGLYGHMEKR